MSFEVISLTDMIDNYKECIVKEDNTLSEKALKKRGKEIFTQFVSSFSCCKNADCENHLKNKAFDQEVANQGRTYFIVNSQKIDEIWGFFSIHIHILDITSIAIETKQKLLGSGFSNKAIEEISQVESFLISQICKNDKFKTKIQGKDILAETFLIFEKVRQSIGGRFIYLDSIDNEKVIALYKSIGFVELKDKHYSEKTKGFLQSMILPYPRKF